MFKLLSLCQLYYIADELLILYIVWSRNKPGFFLLANKWLVTNVLVPDQKD